jgi:hypothetical protein
VWSRIDQNSAYWKVHSWDKEKTMPVQFENPQEKKLEDQTVQGTSTEKKVELVAEKAAEKSAKIEQKFDKENSSLFTR